MLFFKKSTANLLHLSPGCRLLRENCRSLARWTSLPLLSRNHNLEPVSAMIRKNNLLFEVYSVYIYFLTYGFFLCTYRKWRIWKKYYIFEELFKLKTAVSHGITSKHLWPTSVLKIGTFRIISDIFRHSRRFQGYFRMAKLWSADSPKRTGKMAETRSEINDRRLYWNSNMSRLSEQQILSRARASSLEHVKNLNFWWVILRPRYFHNSINCNYK